MLYMGHRWLKLGPAAEILGMSRKTLWLALREDDDAGFTVLEREDFHGRVWRYLRRDELLAAMGVIDDVAPDRQSKTIRMPKDTS
jgi:hypothetical protein